LLREKLNVSEVSNFGAYPHLPMVIEVYTMKKFHIKEPTIMRIERTAENAHQKLINIPTTRLEFWNDKVPRVEKI
jgi:hypothetical protein